MSTVVVLGTLDTKGEEHLYLAEQIRKQGTDVLVMDVGVGASQFAADIVSEAVATAAGTSVADLIATNDRSHAVDSMAKGAQVILDRLSREGRIDGVIALGGGGGTTLAASAFSVLPVGFPKIIVSTIAAGDVRPFVRGSDVTLTYAVLDIAGLNPITRKVIDNAAGAISGMSVVHAKSKESELRHTTESSRGLVAVSAFGVTSAAVKVARERLISSGYEPLVFHAVGSGGESLEALIRTGYFVGVLDLTTTELADDLVGGVMSAGPDRLTAAAAAGVAQVVSVGAMDMVNLGPLDSIAPEFRERQLFPHNPQMTLMRTTPEESAELGRRLARKLNASKGPVAIYLPLLGVSSISVPGAPFHDEKADSSLFDAIRAEVSDHIKLVELNLEINDELFATKMADALIGYMNAEKGES